jgi:hypothetical protein
LGELNVSPLHKYFKSSTMKKILLSAALFAMQNAYAQLNGELDQTFNPALTTTGSIIVQDDGKILLGGTGPRRLNADGSLDPTYPQFTHIVTCLIKDGTGVYGFGYGARHYNANGNVDTPNNLITTHYGLGASVDNGRVNSAVQLPNGDIFAVGDFDYVNHNSGSLAINRIIIYDETLAYNTSGFNNIGTGFNAAAMWVDVDTINEKVYVVGKFTSYDGNPANGICRLNYDGTFDNTFNSGTGFPVTNAVFPEFVRVMSDGRVLVSGDEWFQTTYNGTSFNFTIMLNNDGSQNTTFQPSFPGFGNVYDLEELSDNRMIIASHTGTGGDLAVVNSLTGALIGGSASFPSGFGTNNNISNTYINNITKVEEGVYLLGGNFDTFSGEAKTNLVKVNICDRYENPTELITFNNNQLSSSVNGTSYLWIAEDMDENPITIPNNTDQTITPTVPGYYRLTVTDEPCVFISSYYSLLNLQVNENEVSNFSIYPNPAKNQVSIDNVELGSTITIFDVSGKIVYSAVANTSATEINVSAFVSGMYFVQVQQNGVLIGTQKLQVQ